MRHLVTGGAGFFGSHLGDPLTARGDSVIALDDPGTRRGERLVISTAARHGGHCREPTREIDEAIDDLIVYEQSRAVPGRLRFA